MYGHKLQRMETSGLKGIKAYEGDTIEVKVAKLMTAKEPIGDNAPLNYSERKEGVLPETDIRTDRFEVAQEAMTNAAKSSRAKREAKVVPLDKKEEPKPGEPGNADGTETK